jgi:hypothetical protein
VGDRVTVRSGYPCASAGEGVVKEAEGDRLLVGFDGMAVELPRAALEPVTPF